MKYIEQQISMGKQPSQIVNTLVNSTKIRNLTLSEIKYVTDFINKIEGIARTKININ